MQKIIENIGKLSLSPQELVFKENYAVGKRKYLITTTSQTFNGKSITIKLDGIYYNGFLLQVNNDKKYFLFSVGEVVPTLISNGLSAIFTVSFTAKTDNELVTFSDIEEISKQLPNKFLEGNVEYFGKPKLLSGKEADTIRNNKFVSVVSDNLTVPNIENTIFIGEFDLNIFRIDNESPKELDIDIYIKNNNFSSKHRLILNNTKNIFGADSANEYEFSFKQEYFNLSNKNTIIQNIQLKVYNTFAVKLIPVTGNPNKVLIAIECTITMSGDITATNSTVSIGIQSGVVKMNDLSTGTLSDLKKLHYKITDFNLPTASKREKFIFNIHTVGYNNYGELTKANNSYLIEPSDFFNFDVDRPFGNYFVNSIMLSGFPRAGELNRPFLAEIIQVNKNEAWESEPIIKKFVIQKITGTYMLLGALAVMRAERIVEFRSIGVFNATPWIISDGTTAPHTHTADVITETATRKFISPTQLTLLTTLSNTIFRPESVNEFTDLATTYPTPTHGTLVYVSDDDMYYKFSSVSNDWESETYSVATPTTTGVVNPELYALIVGLTKLVTSKTNTFIHNDTVLNTIYGGPTSPYLSNNVFDIVNRTTPISSIIGEHSILFGFDNLIGGTTSNDSIIVGRDNIVSLNNRSISIGNNHNITNTDTIALGVGIKTFNNKSITLGYHNSVIDLSDILLSVGNGIDDANRFNQLTLSKVGLMTLYGTSKGYAVDGGTSSQVLLADGGVQNITALHPLAFIKTLTSLTVTSDQKLKLDYVAQVAGTSTPASIEINLSNLTHTDYFGDISGAVNGINKVFTASRRFLDNSVKVYRGGLRQTRGALADFTEMTDQKIEFTSAPVSGELLVFDYIPRPV